MAAIETDTASDAEMKGVMEALDSSTSVPEIYFASNTRACLLYTSDAADDTCVV